MSTGDKLKILLDIIVGLHDLHASGIVHGDIKPHNVLLSNHIPPILKIVDFGLSKANEDLIMKGFSESSLVSTNSFGGTIAYCAPELNPHITGEFKEPTRSSDIYSFALVAWQVLSFRHLPRNLMMPVPGSSSQRPPLTDLPRDTPSSVSKMIEKCWDTERKERLPASHCLSAIQSAYDQFQGGNFDLFFSHAWVNKDILSHLQIILVRNGYRVWYDEINMGFSLKDSMKQGITSSKIILICLNAHYQSRANCLFELREAVASQKPIVVFLLQNNPMDWVNEEVKIACNLTDHLYVDGSDLVSNFNWSDVQTGDFDSPAFKALEERTKSLKKILSQLNCFPVFEGQSIPSILANATQPTSTADSTTALPPQLATLKEADLFKHYIICDIGADTVKFVLNTDSFKVYSYRTVIGKLHTDEFSGINDVEYIYGEEVWNIHHHKFGGEHSSSFEIIYPIEHINLETNIGLVIKWSELLQFLYHIITEKFFPETNSIASFNCPIIININGSSAKDFPIIKKKLTDLFSNQLMFSKVLVADIGFFAALSRGLSDMCFINIGELSTQVVFFTVDGIVHDHSINLGGYHVTQSFADLLAVQRINLDFEQVRKLKEKYCYCTFNIDVEKDFIHATNNYDEVFLPDGRRISLTTERFLAVEVLFNPINSMIAEHGIISNFNTSSLMKINQVYTIFSSSKGYWIPGTRKVEQSSIGLPEFIYEQITKFYSLTAKKLPIINIYGGTANIPGLRQRLTRELKQIMLNKSTTLTPLKVNRIVQVDDITIASDLYQGVAKEKDLVRRFFEKS